MKRARTGPYESSSLSWVGVVAEHDDRRLFWEHPLTKVLDQVGSVYVGQVVIDNDESGRTLRGDLQARPSTVGNDQSEGLPPSGDAGEEHPGVTIAANVKERSIGSGPRRGMPTTASRGGGV